MHQSGFRGSQYGIVAGRRIAISYVGANAVVKENDVLSDHCDLVAQRIQAEVSNVFAIDQNASRGHVVKTQRSRSRLGRQFGRVEFPVDMDQIRIDYKQGHLRFSVGLRQVAIVGQWGSPPRLSGRPGGMPHQGARASVANSVTSPTAKLRRRG